MPTATALYTPQVLTLATSLAQWPWDAALPLLGEARSSTCGSKVAVGLQLAGNGAIERIGLRVHACAIGQASAAIFAAAALGLTLPALAESEQALSRWLGGDAPMPEWPGLSQIAAARNYPARHGAILLGWKAALAALPSASVPR